MVLTACCVTLPLISHAQINESIYSLNGVLDRLFEEMLPLCSRMIDVGRAIAGLGAMTYIATRVWKHIAQAEPINFYPLLRPFAIGLAVLMFPALIALMNGVLKPVVKATEAMAGDSKKAALWHIEQEEKSIMEPPQAAPSGNNDDLEKYEQDSESGGIFSGLKNAFNAFNLEHVIYHSLSKIFGVINAAAGLCVNTIRTFYLIVLVILGPLVLGLSVFEGFQHTLSSWFARYINVYLWLPVANIFGAISSKILENMLTLNPDFAGSIAYSIFLIISIVGYFTVPTVAGFIIQAGGRDSLLNKINQYTAAAGAAFGKIV